MTPFYQWTIRKLLTQALGTVKGNNAYGVLMLWITTGKNTVSL